MGDKLDASAKSQVEADLTALKDALAAAPAENMTPDQVADIKAKQDTLMNSANALFAKVYEQAQGAGRRRSAARSRCWQPVRSGRRCSRR